MKAMHWEFIVAQITQHCKCMGWFAMGKSYKFFGGIWLAATLKITFVLVTLYQI